MQGASAGTTPLDEGYTGHQMLDQFNLIHMNGRVFDPTVGRFLSPDILIQAPQFSQSYNRYSYVMNGPMQYVDPSGYASDGAGSTHLNIIPWQDPHILPDYTQPMRNVSVSIPDSYVTMAEHTQNWVQSMQFQMPILTGLQTGNLSSIPMGVPEPTRNNTFMSGLLTRAVDESVQAAVDLGMYSLLGGQLR